MKYSPLIFLALAATTADAKITITKNTCNYQDGLAVCTGDIRLGWQMLSDTNDDKQTAYQILVTENVTGKKVFKSKKKSEESQFIAIPRLKQNRHGYLWKVRVWDKDGKPSEWSKEQQIRIVAPYNTARSTAPSNTAPSNSPKGESADQTKSYSASNNKDSYSASNNKDSYSASSNKGNYSPLLRGGVGGGASSPFVGVDGGPSFIGAITKSAAKLPEGRFSNAEFKKDYFKEKWNPVDSLSAKSIIMRKEFSNEGKKITDAVVYISGMGHYEMHINGKKVGDSEFAPLWSEYSKTIYYNTYDVTDLLSSGDNAISVLLGNGFFNVQRGTRYSKLMTSFGAPQMIMRMDINYSDGTSKTVVSDLTWKYALSPVTFNSIYGGESYDARLVQKGFDRPGFNDSTWKDVVRVEGAGGSLEPQTAQPVKIMERFGIKSWKYLPADSVAIASEKTKRKVSPHTFIADMGQNLAGFPEITVKGKPGQKVTMLVSENLNKQGVCDQRQTGRQHYYEYTIGSDTAETWHPRFSYYGFRYIQVEDAVLEGEPNPYNLPVISKLQSCFVYNSAEEGSSFECSNPLFTQTHRLIERAERSNMQSVMTDCPHREKLGWLEQDHLVGPSLFYNFDMTQYCPKIIRDITDTQKSDGMVPTTAPQYVSFGNLFDDSPEWGSTLVIMPFQYYEQYGDSTLITRNYTAMRRYVDYLTSRSKDGIVSHGLGDWYDVVEGGKSGFCKNTPIPLVATAHYIYDLQLITRAARMVENKTDEERYSALYNKVVDAFNREFYHADSCYYGSGSQTSNALPLFLGITGENKEKVLQSLIKDIEKHGNRLTTGDVGNRYLFMTLAMNNEDELLYTMLNHYDTPGYGFQIKQGATTLTEQWDPRQGSSWNHLMMGQIDEWFFKRIAGIQNKPGTYGMRHLLISPTLVGDLKDVHASTTTLYGKVSVDYSDRGLTVEIPVGCDADIVLNNGTKIATVGSGIHTFNAMRPRTGKKRPL